MNSGVLGAEAVEAWLRKDPATEERFLHFERMVRRGVKTFSWFIWRFNSPGMRGLMPSGEPAARQGSRDVLVGR